MSRSEFDSIGGEREGGYLGCGCEEEEEEGSEGLHGYLMVGVEGVAGIWLMGSEGEESWR